MIIADADLTTRIKTPSPSNSILNSEAWSPTSRLQIMLETFLPSSRLPIWFGLCCVLLGRVMADNWWRRATPSQYSIITHLATAFRGHTKDFKLSPMLLQIPPPLLLFLYLNPYLSLYCDETNIIDFIVYI